MEDLLRTILYGALFIHIVLLLIVLWQVWLGEHVVDRLVGADLIVTLTLGVIVLIALLQAQSIYMDVALGLAALGFVGTIALSKYIADEQMF